MNAQLSSYDPSPSLRHKLWKLTKVPMLLGLLVTPIRFSLEMLGLPDLLIFPIGALWLALGLSIYWATKLSTEANAHLLLLLCLAVFSPVSRIPIAVLWWADNNWGIGSHYGLFFDNLPSALLNQVGYGSLIQILPGFLLGAVVIAIKRYRSQQSTRR